MKKLLMSALVFCSILSDALAAEPLTEKEMDAVTAGLADRGWFNPMQARQKQYRYYLADVEREFIPG